MWHYNIINKCSATNISREEKREQWRQIQRIFLPSLQVYASSAFAVLQSFQAFSYFCPLFSASGILSKSPDLTFTRKPR